MRRKQGELVPLEKNIIEVLNKEGGLHGFEIARRIGGKPLAYLGTMYRALDRLVNMGRLRREWEPEEQIEPGRPRRRYYWTL